MKHKILFGALCASAALLSSCNEEDIVKMPHAVGDEIVFGARAGFENADNSSSRTVYSGETYHVGEKIFERIDWEPDFDKVQIYCPQADATKKTVNYTVTGAVTPDNEKSYSTLTKSASEVRGLQWGSDDEHTFYAMYPSAEMLAQGSEEYIKMKEKNILGYIPPIQEADIKKTTNGYVIKPDMNFAYMAAKNSEYRTSGDAVNLTFYPLVTAIEMTLTLDEGSPNQSMPLSSITISTEDAAIAGSFEYNLDSQKLTIYGEEAYSFITINIPKNGIKPTTLQKGQSITFTLFLIHENTIEDLTLTIVNGKGSFSKVLDNINIIPYTKHIIKGLKL